jgi:acetyl esterase/lipase
MTMRGVSNSFRFLIALGICLLGSTVDGPAQNTEFPVIPPGVEAHRDIIYSQRDRQRPLMLDLYLPAGANPKPLVIWIHGGGWRTGDKGTWVHPLFLTALGYAVASIDYRFSDEAIFPAQIEDCKTAVRFLRASAAEYHLDSERFAVCGESAGGQLASLLGMTGGSSELTDAPDNPVSDRVQAVIELCGPSDFAKVPDGKQEGTAPYFAYKLFGQLPSQCPELVRAASPVYHISAQTPPFLILHGKGDPIVPLAQSEELFAALQKAKVASELVVVPVAYHVGPDFWTPPMQEKMAGFLKSALRLPVLAD